MNAEHNTERAELLKQVRIMSSKMGEITDMNDTLRYKFGQLEQELS
jgi:hypothetical protein